MKDHYVFVCYENPGHGGASTAAYALFEMLQGLDGPRVSYVSLIDPLDRDYYASQWTTKIGNPRNLENVSTVFLRNRTFARQPEFDSVLSNLSPDIVIAVGYIAASVVRSSGRPYLFLTSGCNQVKRLIDRRDFPDAMSVRSALQKGHPPVPRLGKKEIEAVEHASYVVTHSDDILFFFQHLFPEQARRLHPVPVSFAEWIAREASHFAGFARPFEERDIDVLFIASHWDRPEKNFGMLLKILSTLRNRNFHVLGEVDARHRERKSLRRPKDLHNTCFHGHVSDRGAVFRLMGNAKTIVSTSSFDAAPGILFEGAVMGCNLVASRNCGNWRICHPELLVADYRAEAFCDRIDRSLTRKYPDGLSGFLAQGGLAELLRILEKRPWRTGRDGGV